MKNRSMGWLGAMMMAGALAGCGGPLHYEIHGSPKSPEIDAKITAKVDKAASMSKLTISIEHLAPPGRIGSDASTFVVWARGGDSKQWQRVGALKYDEGDRKGELSEASVPLVDFDLQITAEKKAAPESPGSDTLIAQRVAD